MSKITIFGVNFDFGSLQLLNYWSWKLQIFYRTNSDISQHFKIKIRSLFNYFDQPILRFMSKMTIFWVNFDFGSLQLLNYWGYKLQIFPRTSPHIYLNYGQVRFVNHASWTALLNFPIRPQTKFETPFLLDDQKSLRLFWDYSDFVNKLSTFSYQ